MKIECPHCRQRYEADESYAGQIVECSSCYKEFKIQKGISPKIRQQLINIYDSISSNIDDEYQKNALAFNMERTYEKAVQELHGIAFIVAHDDNIDDGEVESVLAWLNKNYYFAGVWPISEVYDIYSELLKKSELSPEWKAKLLNTLKNLSTEHKNVIEFDFDDAANIVFLHKTVVITGAFQANLTRRKIVGRLLDIGAYAKENGSISGQTDIVIVGEKGSDAWKFSGYGRKIESAIALKKELPTMKIIKESSFLKHHWPELFE